MAESVELRADLTHFSDHHLLIADPAIRLRQYVRTLRQDAQLPARKEGHFVGIENLTQFNNLAAANQLRGLEHLLGFHQVSGTALIAGTPLRRTPLAFSRRSPRLCRRSRRDEQNCKEYCEHGSHIRTSLGVSVYRNSRQETND